MASLDERACQELAEASAFENFGHPVGWIEQAHGLPFAGSGVLFTIVLFPLRQPPPECFDHFLTDK